MMCRLNQKTIEDILQIGRIFEVGGAVRDMLLFSKAKDRDYLVTGVPYKKLAGILKNHGRVDLVGQSFGVIKFTQAVSGEPHTFDISLPRKERSTGVGHKDFEVEFDPSLDVRDDLLRRDFTINAMAKALDNEEIIDPLEGQKDLSRRLIRMVSPSSFIEDPLRMLRAIQFAARFEFEIEPDTLKAIKQNAALINSVSNERIAEELNKMLLRSKKPSLGLRLMEQTGLLKEILPEFQKCVGVDQPGGFHKYDVFDHTLYVIDASPTSLRLRLAALFHDITKPTHKRLVDKGATFYGHEVSGADVAVDVLTRLRYPNDLIKEVAILVERHMFTTDVSDKGLRRLVKKVGVDLIFDLLNLRRADVIGQGMGGTTEDVDAFETAIKEELAKKPPFGLSDLAIDGNRIMALFDIPPGPIVGKILNHLMEKVLDEPSVNTREDLESFAKEYYLKDIMNR